ncbi:MAG: acyl-CoA dehydrogenase [Chloroflexi bacterium]|nr:acyl-CoA dehydrogenase [Chloroflexota bacterium]
MDFSLTAEQELLKKEARHFLDAEFPKKLVKEIEASESGYSPELWRKMADLGWLGLVIPEQYGGVGGSLMDLAIILEEIGKTACPMPFFSTVVMGVLPVLEGGSEDQKKSMLPSVAQGNMLLTMAATEHETDLEPEHMTTRARRKRDGFSVTGSKVFVPYAHVADLMFVVARTGSVRREGKGISILIVPKGAEGTRLTHLAVIGGERQFEVDFERVHVATRDVIGFVDCGWKIVGSILQKAVALQCVQAVGVMQQELSLTAEYTSKRVQFGRPIGSFQAVQHRLADMLTDVEGARWTTYLAVDRLTKGAPAAREVAVAKAWTGDACQRVAYGAQHLHGGIGMDMEYDLQYYFRWARSLELNLGPAWTHLPLIEPVIRG